MDSRDPVVVFFEKSVIQSITLLRKWDLTESLRGLLGHFSSTQMDLIESLVVSMGEPDPWGSIINPICAAASPPTQFGSEKARGRSTYAY